MNKTTHRTKEDERAEGWRADPYLHFESDCLFNPHTDRRLMADHPRYEWLKRLALTGETLPTLNDDRAGLAADGWLINDDDEIHRRYRIKYVSIEALAVCNHGCYFCPVSTIPREPIKMPTALYERVINEIAALGEPIEGVVLNHYNEPTADARFLDQIRCIIDAGLPAATLSNGSGLVPKRVDALLEMGGLSYLAVNISSLDRQTYAKQRGKDHLPLVLDNLDYMGTRPVAEVMDLVVLGTGDDAHRAEFERIAARFADSRFEVKHCEVNDRAGHLDVGGGPGGEIARLGGCEEMGSRVINHIHISARGRCILCCQDYLEQWEAGDLHRQSLEEILRGDDYARLRRWVYGIEEAPKDFLCRTCKFALHRPAAPNGGER